MRLIRTVSISKGIDDLVETTRKKLGLDRSRFYEVAVIEYLRTLSVLSGYVKSEVAKDVRTIHKC